MLAIPPRHATSICARCALRLRLAHFQQQRRPQSSHAPPSTASSDGDSDFISLKHRHVHISRGTSSSDRDRNGNDSERTLSGGVVRLLSGRGKRHLDDNKKKEHKLGFGAALKSRLLAIKDQVKDAPVLKQLAKDRQELDGEKEESFAKLWSNFEHRIMRSESSLVPFLGPIGNATDTALWEDLNRAWHERGQHALDERLKYLFYGFVTNSRFTESDIRNQVMLADLRYPSEWFPATRQMQRTIHLHVGPTNSGKTYRALQRLEAANGGLYAGPLRLLAHEVYTRLNAKGKSCSLITGEERRMSPNKDSTSVMSACTVEMTPVNKEMDVAVIDEIQMIGSPDRGWAWTEALMGVKAREVHLCGETRAVGLIREICASLGEKLEVHHYERLSPLQMAEASLDGDLRRLRKGDCVVSFTVMGIHALRRQIEKFSGRKCAIVYGSLPPETRAQQARLFNDPNNDYDFLIASDAVGMGLNLAIKRIVFETSSKFDGIARRTLSIADIKQIGGRAGRFRTAAQATEAPLSEQDLAAAKGEPDPDNSPSAGGIHATPDNVGLVTTLERFDFPVVANAMRSEPEPIKSAGIFPPAVVLERFANYFPPGTPFSYIMTRLHELSQIHKRFHLCGLRDHLWIADIIEPVEGLTVSDRMQITAAPCGRGEMDLWKELLPAFARCIAQQTGGGILDIKEIRLETLEKEATESDMKNYLKELETLHKSIVTYLWLSYRFAGIFKTRPLAFHVKGLVEQKIEHVLGEFSFSESQRRKLARAREKQLMRDLMRQQQEKEELEGETGVSEKDVDYADRLENAMAQLAEEEPESEVGVQASPVETNDPADGGSFSGEPYLNIEEEPEVEAVRLGEADTEQKPDSEDDSLDPDSITEGATSSEQKAASDFDPDSIIEEMTRHVPPKSPRGYSG